ncbi:MAG TPA: hypothetical protein VD999_00585 [Vitreimonas sp.]|nr:hypothetical protein [Vitreimonas sp.]
MPLSIKKNAPAATDQSLSTFQVLQGIVMEVTGNETHDVTPEFYLEEMSLVDFPQVISRINQYYDHKIKLSAKDVLAECETLEELVFKVEEELEWG